MCLVLSLCLCPVGSVICVCEFRLLFACVRDLSLTDCSFCFSWLVSCVCVSLCVRLGACICVCLFLFVRLCRALIRPIFASLCVCVSVFVWLPVRFCG